MAFKNINLSFTDFIFATLEGVFISENLRQQDNLNTHEICTILAKIVWLQHECFHWLSRKWLNLEWKNTTITSLKRSISICGYSLCYPPLFIALLSSCLLRLIMFFCCFPFAAFNWLNLGLLSPFLSLFLSPYCCSYRAFNSAAFSNLGLATLSQKPQITPL